MPLWAHILGCWPVNHFSRVVIGPGHHNDPSIILGPAHVATDLVSCVSSALSRRPALALLDNDHSSGVTRVNLLGFIIARTHKCRDSVLTTPLSLPAPEYSGNCCVNALRLVAAWRVRCAAHSLSTQAAWPWLTFLQPPRGTLAVHTDGTRVLVLHWHRNLNRI